MKSSLLIAIALIAMLTACGGGGGGSSASGGSASSGGGGSGSSGSGPVAIEGRVIDGYVSGATVFVDMNWSLSWEQGEPKTVTDSSGRFQFSEADLANFSCYKRAGDPRLIIVQVPVGATDSVTGAVKAPYEMIYVPAIWTGVSNGSAIVNVTPFTSLFSSAVTDYLKTLATSNSQSNQSSYIAVSDACGTQAGLIADNVRESVGNLGRTLREAGIAVDKFYDDFIASGDKAAETRGQLIVTYLTKFKQISDVLITSFQAELGTIQNSGTRYGFNAESIRSILQGDPKAVSFDIFAGYSGAVLSNGDSANLSMFLKGLRLRADGQVLSTTCTASDPYSCPVVSIASSDDVIKAAQDVFQSGSLGQSRSLVFTKAWRVYRDPSTAPAYECQKRIVYSYEPTLSPSSKAAVSQLEFSFEIPLGGTSTTQNRFGCNPQEGTAFVMRKKLDFAVRGNGYTYSLFNFGTGTSFPSASGATGGTGGTGGTGATGSTGSTAVSFFTVGTTSDFLARQFPSIFAYVNSDPIKGSFDEERVKAELRSLPSDPRQIDSVGSVYPKFPQVATGNWFFQTGSKSEDALLVFNPVSQGYQCRITDRDGTLLKTSGENVGKAQALSLCYPDTSVFD